MKAIRRDLEVINVSASWRGRALRFAYLVALLSVIAALGALADGQDLGEVVLFFGVMLAIAVACVLAARRGLQMDVSYREQARPPADGLARAQAEWRQKFSA